VWDCTVPGVALATLCCRVNCKKIADLGVVEETHEAIRLASGLNWLDSQRKLLVQCINSFMKPV